MRRILMLMAGAVTLTSCTHYYYIPNSQNVPLFKEEKELKISGSVTPHMKLFAESKQTLLELQGAYAVTDRIGVMANFMTVSARGTYESINLFGPGDLHWNGGKGWLGEAGVGYYKPISEKWVFETYGGFGMGTQKHYYESETNKAILEFSKIWVQPSIGYVTEEIDVAFTARVSQLHFDLIDCTWGVPDYSKASLNFLNSNSDKTMFEPGVTFRFGWDTFKFHLQPVASLQVGGEPFTYNSLNINMGINFLISKRYDKK